MDEQYFQQFLNDLQNYLQQPKVFVTDLNRAREFYNCVALAKRIFNDDEITIEDDPLQAGAMIMNIETTDIVIRGKKEINYFYGMVAKADNFEIYPKGKEKICLAAVFNNVNKRV